MANGDNNEFLISGSGNLGRNQRRKYQALEPETEETKKTPPKEQEEEYLRGAGQELPQEEDRIEEMIRNARLKAQQEEAYQTMQNLVRGFQSESNLEAAYRGVRTGVSLRGGVGKNFFNDIIIIALALVKDLIDFFGTVATLGLGGFVISATVGIFISMLLLSIRMFRGGALHRWVLKLIIIWLLDITVGAIFVFLPVTTIGIILLIHQEKKKFKNEQEELQQVPNT